MALDLGPDAQSVEAGAAAVPPEAASPLAARPATRNAVRIAFLCAIGWFVFVAHGLSLHLGPWSQALVNSLTSATFIYGEAGQRDGSVLLFREESLRELGTTFPVPHAVHAQVLSALGRYAPRAVFVDFAFIDRRHADVGGDAAGRASTELAGALCGLRDAGVAVYLAAPADDVAGESVLSELRACATAVVSAGVGAAYGVSGVLDYPATSSPSHRHRRPGDAPDCAKQPLATAAFAMAVDVGGPLSAFGADEAACENGSDRTALLGLRVQRLDGMEIVWANRESALNRKWMRCERPEGLEALRVLLAEGPLALRSRCPYTRTVTVGHLLREPETDADMQDALRARTVFYGAGFRLTGDRVTGPVTDELPGVYLHAMAWDNLVTFGADYKRKHHHGAGGAISIALLVIVAALLVTFPREPVRHVETLADFRERVLRVALAFTGIAFVFAAALLYRGLDTAIWALLAAYVFYRWKGVRDRGFLWLLVAVAAFSALGYAVLDVGPRNVLAYFAFFEVIRHAQHTLGRLATTYFSVRGADVPEATGVSPRFVRVADWCLGLYREEGGAHPPPAPAGTPTTANERGLHDRSAAA